MNRTSNRTSATHLGARSGRLSLSAVLAALFGSILIVSTPVLAQGTRQAQPGDRLDPVGSDAVRVRPVPRPPQDDYRPQRIKPRIWTDRQIYNLGDTMRIYFSVNENAHVYIFNTDAAGRRTQIFPNYFDQENRVRAGRTYAIPDGSYDLEIQPPAGTESLTIMAVAEDYPIIRRHYHSFSQSQPFATNIKSPEDFVAEFESASESIQSTKGDPGYREKVIGGSSTREVVPVPRRPDRPIHPAPAPYRYGLKTISFDTRDPYYRPPVQTEKWGSLRISSRPHNAYIYIDGKYRGRTTERIRLRAGYHDIEVRKPGYSTAYRRIYIGPYESSSIVINLDPEYRYPGDIYFNLGYDGDDWKADIGVRRDR